MKNRFLLVKPGRLFWLDGCERTPLACAALDLIKASVLQQLSERGAVLCTLFKDQ